MAKTGFNRAVLIGDVEHVKFRTTPTGKSRLWIRVHTHELTIDEEGEERERHAWNNVIVWGKRGEALQHHIVVGTRLAVEGRLVNSSWEKDGRKNYETEIYASSIVFLDRRPAAA